MLRLTAGIVIVGGLAVSGDLAAQIRASERGASMQTIDGTTITVDYSRPSARGRENLYGGVVPWGKVWTPGANWATTLTADRDIELNGHEVPAGEYSVWFEVQPEAWTVVLDPQPRRFHLMPPRESGDQVRFDVVPDSGAHVEMLTWSFPEVNATGGTLRFAWGPRRIDFDIDVEPSMQITVEPDFAERYVGRYSLMERGPLGGDTVSFEIRYENDRLVASWEDGPNPRLQEFWLFYRGAGMFSPIELENGEVFDMLTDLIIEFDPTEDEPSGWELRALDDQLWGTAVRADDG